MGMRMGMEVWVDLPVTLSLSKRVRVRVQIEIGIRVGVGDMTIVLVRFPERRRVVLIIGYISVRGIHLVPVLTVVAMVVEWRVLMGGRCRLESRWMIHVTARRGTVDFAAE
jgi:hypothetical protein